ncbi:unnamed protein product [Coregonus sp. 'balchen']|nr:unnamed protein product [Coregonus sp. 'balchen']
MTLEAIRYRAGSLQILNQLLLPHETVFDEVRTVQDGYEAIKSMKARNITLSVFYPSRFLSTLTPCHLPRVAMLTAGVFVSNRVDLLCELCTLLSVLSHSMYVRLHERCAWAKVLWPVIGYLLKSMACVRGAPAIAIVGCLSLAVELRAGAGGNDPVTFIRESLCHLTSARPTAVNMGRAARELMEFAENESMEKNPEQLTESVIGWIEEMLERDVNDNKKIGNYGAQHILSGVVRSLHTLGRLKRMYCTETRPYNQGARLTAYEAVAEGFPATLITDSMAALTMREKSITAVVVGADRVVANGAATIAVSLAFRPGIDVWNPAFDVTPHQLITGGIITELGVFLPSELQAALTGRLTAL